MTLSQAKAGQLAMTILDLVNLVAAGARDLEIQEDDFNEALSLVRDARRHMSNAEKALSLDIETDIRVVYDEIRGNR